MYFSNDDTFSSPLNSPLSSPSPSPPPPSSYKLDPNVQNIVTEFIKNKDNARQSTLARLSRPQEQSSGSSRKRRSSDSILHSVEVRALLGITASPIKEEDESFPSKSTPNTLSFSSEVKTSTTKGTKAKGNGRSKSNPSTPKKGHRRNLSNPTSLADVVPEFDKIQLPPQPAGLGAIQEDNQDAVYEANFQATKQMLSEQRAKQVKDLEEMSAFYHSRARNPNVTQQEMLMLQEQMEYHRRLVQEQDYQLQQLEQWKEHLSVQQEQKQKQLEDLQRQLHERMMRKYEPNDEHGRPHQFFGQMMSQDANYYANPPQLNYARETFPSNDVASLETMLSSSALDNVDVTDEDYNNMMVIISSMNNACLVEGNAGENVPSNDAMMDTQVTHMEEEIISDQGISSQKHRISSVRSLERFLDNDLEQLTAAYQQQQQQQQQQGEMVDVDYWMNSVLV